MFDNFIGQDFLINKKTGILQRMIDNQKFYSFIFYAPVGTGKTTLANLFLENINASFTSINACDITYKELKDILSTINNYPNYWLIIDEIHRLDKKQQNLILPYLDNNLYIIGTTSENPYSTLNNAIRSRMVVFEFKSITHQEYINGIKNYTKQHFNYELADNIIEILSAKTKHDIRSSFNFLNMLFDNYNQDEINLDLINNLLNTNFKINFSTSYHYDLISCLQKSIRASDVNASLYYLACLIKADDLDGIIRRLGVIAYEDIGLANSNLCAKTINALNYVKKLGLPEGRIILSDLVIELAISPKSKSGEHAIDRALDFVDKQQEIKLPKQLTVSAFYDMELANYKNNLPPNVGKQTFYIPNTNSRYEEALATRYEELEKLHQESYDE